MPITNFAKNAQLEQMQWVVPDLIPCGNVTIASGEPNVGKSRFWTQAGWMLSLGQTIFWPKVDPLRVMLCSERRACEVIEQMKFLQTQFQVDNPNFRLFSIGDMPRKEAQEFNSNPLAALEQHFNGFTPEILIMDTFGHFLVTDSSRGAHNVNDYGSTLLRVRTFNQWCHQWHLALIGIHHMRKQTVNDSALRVQDRTLGSQAIVGGSGQIWTMESLTDESLKTDVRYAKLTLSIHYRPWREPIYLKTGIDLPFSLATESEAIDAKIEPTESLSTAPLQEKVLEGLPRSGEFVGKALLVDAIAQAVKCDSHNIYKAIRTLVKKGKVKEKEDPDTGFQLIRVVCKQ